VSEIIEESSRRTYVRVLVDAPVRGSGQQSLLFDYKLPRDLAGNVRVGHIVRVPFGHRVLTGCVVQLLTEPGVSETRSIRGLVMDEPHLTGDDVKLAFWLSQQYLCHPAVALRAMLPPDFARGRNSSTIRKRLLVATVNSPDDIPDGVSLSDKQRQVLLAAQRLGAPVTRKELSRRADVSGSVVDALIQKGILRWREVRWEQRPYDGEYHHALPDHLTDDQERVMQELEPAVSAGEPGEFLLHGVTGSGKTEIYLRVISVALQQDRDAILMVPEISLTPQMVARVKGRFGDRVAVMHSELTPKERATEWYRLHRGEADVALGPRSAVFAPCRDLGVIVLDEEHDSAYKQESAPRYHARRVARRRAERAGCPLLLGSATPCLESYHRARSGQATRLSLPRRVDERPMPEVTVVDIREEWAAGNRSLFSRHLHRCIVDRLERSEQSVLFLNRRGYSSFLLCTECGEAIQCAHCNVTMTYHRKEQRLRCHYCDRRMPVPSQCPFCGGHRLARRGAGTQKVEAAVRAAFPGAVVARLDTDSARIKGTRGRVYQQFASGDVDILVGTQMVAKGWDVPGVTLVGVIDADTALNFPDFRSAERTFQLLLQVAGRAGRGERSGEVIIQTMAPAHPAVVHAASGDLDRFYRCELDERRQVRYPPYGGLVRLLLRGRPEARVQFWAQDLARQIQKALDTGVEIIGPAPAPIDRIKDSYRWHLLLKMDPSTASLAGLEEVLQNMRVGSQDPRITVDVDPMQML